MDTSTKKACFDEISHRICDSDLKVSINDISSDWKVNLRESEGILLDWCADHSSTTVSKEYLIRGVDLQGHCVITVVSEKRLDKAKQLFPQFCSSLFSIELPSTSNRLGTHQLSNGVVINLPLDGKTRKARSQAVQVVDVKPAVKVETKNEVTKQKNMMFGAKKTVDHKTPTQQPKETPEKVVKVEVATPKKESPKKNSNKTPASKPSIASFFSKPAAVPKTGKPTKEEPMEEETEIHMAEPEEVKTPTPVKQNIKKNASPKSIQKSRKRSVADTQDSDDGENGIPATPQPSNKRVRKETSKDKSANKTKSATKKKAKENDSSDDDIPASPEPMKVDKKASRFRRIVDSDSEDETSAASTIKSEATTKRRKAKRTVTRMYEDENGYMKSVKEIEEYTCSEDEADEQPTSVAVKTSSTAETKSVATENIPPKKNNAKTPPKTTAKKITPPKAGNKQGSILSFFSKK